MAKKRKYEKTAEAKVADAILQEPIVVTIDGTRYEVAQPTIATLIKASKYISYLPAFDIEATDVLSEVLRNAKDCKIIGKIVATLILGARRLAENRIVSHTRYVVKAKKRHWWQLRKTADDICTVKETVTLREVDWLASVVSERMSIVELRDLLITLLGSMQVADFFGITISLSATSLTKPNEEMGKSDAVRGVS